MDHLSDRRRDNTRRYHCGVIDRPLAYEVRRYRTGVVATALAVEHGGSIKTGDLILGSADAGPAREDMPNGQKNKRWCAGFRALWTI